MKKARNVIVSSKFNDLNILPVSPCCSIFWAWHVLLEANKSLPLNILAGYDQKYLAWASSPYARQSPKSTRKSSILKILRISPCGSISCRWRKLSGNRKPLPFNILRELEGKNRTRLRRASLAFSIIYSQNLGNNRLIPEASRAPVRQAGARAGETPTAPPRDQRSARSGIPARSCVAARSAPPPDGIAR